MAVVYVCRDCLLQSNVKPPGDCPNCGGREVIGMPCIDGFKAVDPDSDKYT